MNNAIRSILGILATISAAMAAIGGCVADNPATPIVGDAVCTAHWIPPDYAAGAAVAFSGIALIMKALRPGGVLGGLFGSTAVVVSPEKAGPGTVTKAQVNSIK